MHDYNPRAISLFSVIPGVKNFTWAEALYLRKWQFHAFPQTQEILNITSLALTLQSIRDLVKSPIIVTSWYRPPAYNDCIGGAVFSSHKSGLAVDFQVKNKNCDEVRKILLPKLVELNIRMEDNPKSDWVHIDKRNPGIDSRFFKV